MDNIEEVEKRIEENLRKKNVRINLSNLNLTGNEDILKKLKYSKHLLQIRLENNLITNTSFLLELNKIQRLYLRRNEISDISFIKKWTTLKHLDLSENLIKDYSPIVNLKKLQGLFLGANEISDYSFIQNLTSVQSLSLFDSHLSDISFLSSLKILTNLNLEFNQISDISVLKELSKLERLYLSANQISDISTLKKLKYLKVLFLSGNQITHIPTDLFDHLKNCTELHLQKNIIENIPEEIFDKDENVLEAVKNYLKSIEKEGNRKELNEAKLIFVGVGEVGKTELSEALSEIKYEFKEGRKSTKGIRVKPWQLVDCKREEQQIDFIAHIWDFAGQEINYGTHQFFLTKNSIYVFVWETRKGEDESKFAYWLRIVSLLSKNAPVLIVQNKIDELVSEVNQKQWKEQFPNIVGFYKTSCKDGTGINTLRKEIQKQLLELPHTREIWNKYRVAVRDELIKSSKSIDYISYKDYLKICEKHTVSKEDAPFLSDQLHSIGSILHFSEDARLNKTVVLNSEWVTDAAYLLLDTKKVEKGRFHFKDLDKIWEDDRFDEKHEFLINLIEKFELIFQFQDSDLYIVPEGLPVEEPTGVAEIKPIFESEKTKYLRFEYHYPFMPKGILSRFICRLHENILEEYFWKNGVVLVLDKETFAKVILNEVENPKTIKIEVWGKQADKFLAITRRNIEHIHSKFEELEIFRKVPCICVECKHSSKSYLHDYDRLKKFQAKNLNTNQCGESGELIQIITLLEGIIETTKIGKGEKIELYSFIEQANYRTFFDYLDNLKVSNHEISKLKNELIGGQSKYDSDFHDRLHILISTL